MGGVVVGFICDLSKSSLEVSTTPTTPDVVAKLQLGLIPDVRGGSLVSVLDYQS